MPMRVTPTNGLNRYGIRFASNPSAAEAPSQPASHIARLLRTPNPAAWGDLRLTVGARK